DAKTPGLTKKPGIKTRLRTSKWATFQKITLDGEWTRLRHRVFQQNRRTEDVGHTYRVAERGLSTLLDGTNERQDS
ncbi:MAG: hypothetical protein K0M58_03165, partial [Thiobacillus sp.]|nr:hypothetical protein [Thiobacillus sp.]